MHKRAIWAIIRKDGLDILKNKATLGGLLSPIFMSLVYLLISNVIGNRATGVLIYNPGSSGLAQVVLEALHDPQVTKAGTAEQVTTAFETTVESKEIEYAVGLVIPDKFEASLLAGDNPQLVLYLDGDKVDPQTKTLLQMTVINYARQAANQEPPVELVTTTIHPPSNTDVGLEMRRFYTVLSLLISMIIGITFVPQLLIEEKEKKTLRMLMVTPASFIDILLGKLFVVLVYQLVLSSVVIAIMGSFTGRIGLVILYTVLGGCFSLALGLLIGALFNTMSAAAAVQGPIIIIYIIAGIFIGPLGQMVGDNLAVKIARALPTYYLADGVYNASQNLGSFASNLIDISVILGSTLILLAAAAWVLRRQSAVAAVI